MSWLNLMLKAVAAALFLASIYYIMLGAVQGWIFDAPLNFVGAGVGVVLFLLSDRMATLLARPINRLQQALITTIPLGRKPEKPKATSWKKPGSKAGKKAPAPKKDQASDWPRARFALHMPSAKLRVPGLRTLKRIAAFFMMCFNFLIGEMALTGPPGNQVFAVFFLVTSLLLADYLWKTRSRAGAD